jgi:hypothetical protein
VKAKYDGKCQACKRSYKAGVEIVAIPPKGKRRRWITRHKACQQAKSRQELRATWTTGTLWRTEQPSAPVTTRFDPSIVKPIAD